jgi:hypothetical protein
VDRLQREDPAFSRNGALKGGGGSHIPFVLMKYNFRHYAKPIFKHLLQLTGKFICTSFQVLHFIC